MQGRHRSYNASVRQRKAPLFTGETKRYVVQDFVCEFNLTADRSHLGHQ